ncbi:centrosome and spindle pole-associated protein 1-like isoform X1 [Clavelina lepadiformis]|uniref:centrosome and spindle pole-associated protein 1-like isoform X1 n=1 Tax=Clavelina lepadiformis TaxID=159417 RepID=UPI0040419A19
MKMHEQEDMERFIAEQRARIAHERETLERNPPSAVTDYIADETNPRKENPLKDARIPHKDITELGQRSVKSLKGKPPTPQILKLGEAYQNQKEKLKEELRQEYRKALAEKQIRTTGVRGKIQTTYEEGLAANATNKARNKDDLDLGLSLPIRDHLSAKERLKLQRNKEYNEFKANKENEKRSQNHPKRLTTFATPISYPTVNEITQTTPPIGNSVKKEVGESYEQILERKRRQEKTYRNDENLEDEVMYSEKPARDYLDDEDDHRIRERKARHAPRRRQRYIERYYDDDDESEEELIQRLRARRRRGRNAARAVDSDEDIDDGRLFKKIKQRSNEDYGEETKRMNSARNNRARPEASIDKQNDLRSKSAPPDQEFTGLPIGNVPSANTVQRRKDEYKLDLQRQMEQNDINKRRSKQLEMRIDASGANDPEKRPNRLHDLSPRQKKVEAHQVSDTDKVQPKKKEKKRTTFKDEESDEDDTRRGFLPRQRVPNYFVPPPANGYYPPQFPSPYDDAYYYYGTRNPLDPSSMPVVPHPGPLQPGLSPLLMAAGGRGKPLAAEQPTLAEESRTPRTGRSQVSFAGNAESSLVSDEKRDKQKKRETMQAYQEELKAQMSIKEQKKKVAKEEQERYEQKIEREAMNYNPWGKGGGGAPMKDIHGNLVSDLRQMHLENEDLGRDPIKAAEQSKKRQQASQAKEELFFTSPRQPDVPGVISPRFGRSNPFEMKETQEQKSQKDFYKDELQRQIEERRRFDMKRKEEFRLLEEKEEMKRQEENRKMQEEYENEKRKQQEKIEEKKRQNEEMQRALEEKRRAAELRRKEEKMQREEEARIANERELQERLNVHKPSSPPIKSPEVAKTPAVQVSHDKPIREVPAATEKVRQQERPVQPKYDRIQTPIVARPEKSRESKRISRELSALRKQLLNEQQRIEDQLRSSDQMQFGAYQPTKIRTEALVDLSRVRQRPVQVRRPPTVQRPNSNALKEFRDIKHRQDDTASLRMFRIQHPETPADTSSFEKQQEDMIKNQLMKIESLKGNVDHPQYSQRSPVKSSRNGFTLLPPSDSYASLLDAETMYIPVVDDNEENLPPGSPPRRARKSSARERRRIARHHEDEGGLTYRAAPDNYSLNSLNSLATLDVERMASKNQDRLNKLKALQADEVSLTDPDDILDRFVNQHKSDLPSTPDSLAPSLPRRPRKGTSISAPQQDRPLSVNTVDTELWLRPGTGPPAT